MSAHAPVAKVTLPRLLRGIAPRPRLHRKLDELRREVSVAWITAPGGSGKTALVASYLKERRLATLWYRVDEGDRDAEDLFYYLRLAVEGRERSRRAGVELPAFSPGAELPRFSRRFFEALYARLPGEAIVVFDDFHRASEESPWQTALNRGIDCARTGISVIVISRAPPPPALARQRVHGEIGFLATADLRFTEEETCALPAARRTGHELSRTDRVAVHAATGGWAAGVSLFIREGRRAPSAMAAAGAETEPIFDYLATAVFSRFSAEEHRLLLCTACLDRFTPEQAEAVSGVSGARGLLMTLYRSGFFLERDDTAGEVFRYHALFRTFLAHEASRRLGADEMRSLRGRAAALMRGDGRVEQAFDLLLQAGDVEGARALVLELAQSFFGGGRVALLLRWLAELPAPIVEADAWLQYWRAICNLTTRPGESRAGLERALDEHERNGDATGAYLAWAGAVQAAMYEGRAWRNVEGWLVRLERIEERCPPFESPDVGAQVASALVMAMALAGADAQPIDRWCARAFALAEKASTPSARVMTGSILMLSYALRGDSGHAALLATQLLERKEEGESGFLAQVAARAAATALDWHQGRAEASLAAAEEGLALMGNRPVPMWQSALLVFGSCAALELGKLAQLERFIERLGSGADSGTPLEVSAYHFVRAQRALASGDFAAAVVAAELSLDRDRAVGFPYGEGKDLHVIARAAFELGDHERVREALAAAKRVEDEHRYDVLRYWRLLLEADVALRSSDPLAARRLVADAFALGRERQLYGGSSVAPGRLAELCRLALRDRIEVDYAKELIRRRRLRADPPPLDVADWPWPVRIHTLSRIGVGLASAIVPIGRARVVALLLKAIAALGEGGRAVSTNDVVSILWPDADGDAGTQAFEVTLVRLRKQLGVYGRAALRVDGGRVTLDRSVCWVDVDALDATIKEALRAGRESPDRERLRGLAEQILALCPGPFVGASMLPPRLFAIDARLRARASSALEALGHALARANDGAAVEGIVARSIEAELCPEALIAQVARAMVAEGRSREARSLLAFGRERGAPVESAEPLLLDAPERSGPLHAKR